MSALAEIYYTNALAILRTERRKAARVNAAYKLLTKTPITAGVEDWLQNPFVKTALTILQALTGNWRVREAIKLLKAAGEEAEQEARKTKRKK